MSSIVQVDSVVIPHVVLLRSASFWFVALSLNVVTGSVIPCGNSRTQ